jgi:Zn-finger nucleic acid-binding protein
MESDGQCGENPNECRGCYVYAGILAEQRIDPCPGCKSAWGNRGNILQR